MKRTTPTKITPLTAIHRFCKECVGGKSQEIETCSDTKCPFYKYRNGKGRPSVRHIREKCLECMGRERNAIIECKTITCPIYIYRLGTNPAREGIGGKNNDVTKRKKEISSTR